MCDQEFSYKELKRQAQMTGVDWEELNRREVAKREALAIAPQYPMTDASRVVAAIDKMTVLLTSIAESLDKLATNMDAKKIKPPTLGHGTSLESLERTGSGLVPAPAGPNAPTPAPTAPTIERFGVYLTQLGKWVQPNLRFGAPACYHLLNRTEAKSVQVEVLSRLACPADHVVIRKMDVPVNEIGQHLEMPGFDKVQLVGGFSKEVGCMFFPAPGEGKLDTGSLPNMVRTAYLKPDATYFSDGLPLPIK